MMGEFIPGRNYEPELNVREFERLTPLLDRADSLPNGVLWPLIANRRTGKTWALRHLEHRLGNPRALFLDLSLDPKGFKPTLKNSCLLLDEPGAMVHEGAFDFIDTCAKLRKRGVKILLALTPCEWEKLRAVGEPGGRRINRDDLYYLDPLREAEIKKLTDRQPAWAGEFTTRLSRYWRQQVYLLELALEFAERFPAFRDDLPALLRNTIEKSNDVKCRYVERVFNEGLNKAQRDVVRRVARCQPLGASQEAAEELCRCHILEKNGNEYTLTDPILTDHLPPPLRIHHVSDLHVGPKTADAVDVKAQGTHGKVLGQGAGAKPVRDAYLDHVSALPAHRKPHLAVVSGDIAEMGRDDLYQEAKEWVKRLESILAETVHPDLAPAEGKTLPPRIMLVPGNHDVDWREVLGSAGARKRHDPFARAFSDHARPRLEELPATRPVAHVAYGKDLGVEFLLLGSAEFGGQQEGDEVWRRLLKVLNDLREDLVDQTDAGEMRKRLDHLSLIDPGLVHDDDLVKARKHDWRQPVRIAVLHHPVSPLPSTEVGQYVGLINAGRVKNLLMEKQFCLVLHGHLHFGWFAAESWPGKHGDWTLHIAAAPTLGSRETQHELGYNTIEVSREGDSLFTIEVTRVAHDTGNAWEAKEVMGPIHLQWKGAIVTQTALA